MYYDAKFEELKVQSTKEGKRKQFANDFLPSVDLDRIANDETWLLQHQPFSFFSLMMVFPSQFVWEALLAGHNLEF